MFDFDMGYLFDYDINNLDLDVVLNLNIEEKIFLLYEKKYISNLINIEVESDTFYLNSNIINDDGFLRLVTEDDLIEVYEFVYPEDLSSLSKKDILIMLAYEMYKLHNIDTFKDNTDLLEMEKALISIFDEYYEDFVLLYTLYFEVGKLHTNW